MEDKAIKNYVACTMIPVSKNMCGIVFICLWATHGYLVGHCENRILHQMWSDLAGSFLCFLDLS